MFMSVPLLASASKYTLLGYFCCSLDGDKGAFTLMQLQRWYFNYHPVVPVIFSCNCVYVLHVNLYPVLP